jgi:hypothetical protein
LIHLRENFRRQLGIRSSTFVRKSHDTI